MATTQTRTRMAPEERKDLIIDVATRQIAERGFNAFTLSRLASESGLTRAGLEHHFPSKEALLVEVLRRRDERDQAAVLEKHGPREYDEKSAWEIIDDFVLRNARQPEIVRLYTILGTEALDPAHPAHGYFAERFASSRRDFVEASQQWHPNPELFAVEVLGALDGLQLQWLRDPGLDLFELWQKISTTLRR